MRSLLLACCLLLAACSASGTGDVQLGDGKIGSVDVGDELVTFAREDAQAALVDAEAHGDIIAAQCWRGIIDNLPELGGTDSPPGRGVLSKYQKLRNIRRAREGGMSDEIKLACGPLLIDAQGNIMKLLAKVGTGPLGGLLP
nr:hypothetical protein [uncultured Dongia sp.]